MVLAGRLHVVRRIILFATVMAITVVTSEAQEVGSAARGLALAKQVCARCHAVEKQQKQSPNDLAPTFQGIASTPGMTGMALSAALQTSHRTMPNVVLDPNELADVVAYILSLK
jgi:mono/diheme cytochrome c family protein